MGTPVNVLHTDKVYTQDEKDKLKIPNIFKTLGFFRLNHNPTQKESDIILDAGYSEAVNFGLEEHFFRILLHIGDISRQHNILKTFGVKSPAGGSQERVGFRRILAWMDAKHPEILYNNLHIWVEFTNYQNLWFYENRTDRNKGSLLLEENNILEDRARVYSFLKTRILQGKDLPLIARHLPAYKTGKNRVKTVIIKDKRPIGSTSPLTFTIPRAYLDGWVKLNGVKVDTEVIAVKAGDKITMQRQLQNFSITRRKVLNQWIKGFIKFMGWTIKEYSEFRKKQNSMEQAFSSKSILGMSNEELNTFFDQLTSGQRSRIYTVLVYKTDQDILMPKEGQWKPIGEAYIRWEKNQEKVAQELREAFSKGDKTAVEKAKKAFKVKSVGMKSIDLLVDVINGIKSDSVIDNTYQSFVEKTPMDVAVFPVIDGSGSMQRHISYNGIRLSVLDIALTMGIFFSTRNPVPEIRDTFGWFSSNFSVWGNSEYINTAPNKYMFNREKYIKAQQRRVLDGNLPFTTNLKSIKQSNMGDISSTNMGSVITYFINLVKTGKMTAEQLPQAFLFLTDGENNTGISPKQVMETAAAIGWQPLLILWQINPSNYGRSEESIKKEFGNSAMYVTGFNEGVLTQIFEGIKHGAINLYTEFWSLSENARYSVLKL